MTTNKKDLKIIIPFILFVGIGVYGVLSVDYLLSDKPMEMTFKWFGVPTLIFAIYYSYRSTFGYPKEVAVWRNVVNMLTMTVMCGLMFFVAFQGFLILFNCNFGQQNDYQLNGVVTKIESTKSKGGQTSYTLWLYRELENDTVKINIPKNHFSEGHFFTKEMKEGSLGFIYSNQ